MQLKIYKSSVLDFPMTIKHSTNNKVLIVNATTWTNFLDRHDGLEVLTYTMLLKDTPLTYLEIGEIGVINIRDIFFFKSNFCAGNLKGIFK